MKVLSWHVITLSSLCDGWLHEWTSAVPLLRSCTTLILVQFLLAQSTSTCCQSKIFSAFHDLVFPQQDLSTSCPQYCPTVVSWCVQSNVIFVHEHVLKTVHFWHLPARKPAHWSLLCLSKEFSSSFWCASLSNAWMHFSSWFFNVQDSQPYH